MTESETGNPAPLLVKVCVEPPTVFTTTVKDEIEVVEGMFTLKP
jgi:hypothetical protein